jgi:hypothetical protein
MMATTHALVGALVGATALVLAPAHATTAMLAGLAGGLAPDLDVYADHRRTLHYPVFLPLVALPAVGLAALVPSAPTVALAVALAAGAVHSVMDAAGGGLELRPWERTSTRAVYDHHRGVWIRPRRWIRYDGAPEDLLLAAAVGGPLLLVTEGLVAGLVALALGVSLLYVLVRRNLVELVEAGIERLPRPALRLLPRRFDELLVEDAADD